MQYLLMIYQNEAEYGKMGRRHRSENAGGIWRVHPVHYPERQFQGRRPAASPVSTATTVRVRDGKTLTTDGPCRPETRGNSAVTIWSKPRISTPRSPSPAAHSRRKVRSIEVRRSGFIVDGPAPSLPGWSEGPDPESRDSGFVLRHAPGMTNGPIA